MLNSLMRQVKTLPGALISLALLMIILFWVLNFLSRRAPAPVSTAANFVETHANGSAYSS